VNAHETVDLEIMRPDQVATMTVDQLLEATAAHARKIAADLAAISPVRDLAGALDLAAMGLTSTLLLGRATALLRQQRAQKGGA